jgi:hypothetical protein
MAGGAFVAPPFPVIDNLHAISRTVGGSQSTATGRARIIKADPGAGVAGDLRGRAVFRSDHLQPATVRHQARAGVPVAPFVALSIESLTLHVVHHEGLHLPKASLGES